jgi:hypothetical protein
MNVKQVFHYISYLQYPLMAVAVYFVIQPYFVGLKEAFEDPSIFLGAINNMMIFMGLSISFSTLQDSEKTQNKFSKKIWEDPKKGKAFILFFSVFTVLVIGLGMLEYLLTRDTILEEISFGFIVLGIGFIGMIKSMIEMHEYHRRDRQML